MPPTLHRGLAVAWSLVLAVFAFALPRPSTDNSVSALLASDSPEIRAYQRFQNRFGSDEIIVVRVEGADRFTRFGIINTITSTLAAEPSMQGVLSVSSLHPEATTVILDDVFGGPSSLSEQEPELRSPLVQRLGLWTDDGANVYGLAGLSSAEARRALIGRLEQLRERAAGDGVRLMLYGPPLLNLALDQAGRQTERTALPLLLAVAVALLLVLTTSLRSTVALLAPVGLTVLAVDGAFAAAGGVTNLLVNIAKPLLFVIGLASAVHVYFEARQLVERDVPRSAAAWAAARRKALPVLLALLTTALGFGSLFTSSVPPIRSFGIVAGAGLIAMIPSILLTLPLLLFVMRCPAPPKANARFGWTTFADRRLTRSAEQTVAFSLRHPWLGASLAAAVLIGGVVALPALRPEPHAIKYFPTEHPLRADQAALEAAGLGLATMEAVVSSPGATSDVGLLPGLDALAKTGADDPGVATVVGWPHLVKEVQSKARRPEVDRWTLERLASSPAARVFGDQDAVRLSFLLKTIDAGQLAQLKARLLSASASALPDGARLELTGNYDLLLNAQSALLDTIHVSLLWTAILMELALIIAVRSVRLGLIAMIPNLFPVAVNLVIMAVLGIPVDIGTSMTAAIALGIAVDDTLHFTLAAHRTPLAVAARSAGAAIVMSSVVIGLGFAALCTASFLPTVRFGGLCALAMFSALVADLIVLPPLIQWTRGRH